MAIKPENRFINSVNDRMPIKKRSGSTKARNSVPESEWIHYEKMNNPYNSGTADSWYSGHNDIWVEWKYLPKLPVRDLTLINPCKMLTALQQEWLRGRYLEGRNVFVIVGCPDGGVLFRDLSWEKEMSTRTFRDLLQSKNSLAETLRELTSTRK